VTPLAALHHASACIARVLEALEDGELGLARAITEDLDRELESWLKAFASEAESTRPSSAKGTA
jgi:hypothetical protein